METLTSVLVSLRPEIQRRHRRQIRCIGCRVDSDDLYQATCVKAWRARHKCRGSTPAQLRNWVLKIAANEVRSLLDVHLDRECRSVRRTVGEPQPWQASYRDNPVDPLIDAETQAEQAKRVKNALRKVMPSRREVVTLRYIERWPHHRIAKRMGVSVDHSRSMACEGMKQVRELVCAAQLQMADSKH